MFPKFSWETFVSDIFVNLAYDLIIEIIIYEKSHRKIFKQWRLGY